MSKSSRDAVWVMEPVRATAGFLPVLAGLLACGDAPSERSEGAGMAMGLDHLVEEMRIDGHAEELVPIGRGVAVHENGTIAIAQFQDNEVRIYDSSGAPIGTLGGPGEGPGEFLNVGVRGWIGDTLQVADARQQRITSFTRDLELLRIDRVPLPARVRDEGSGTTHEFPFAFGLGVYPDGDLLVSIQPNVDMDLPEELQGTFTARMGPSGDVQALLLEHPDGGGNLVVPGAGVVGMPFSNYAHSAVSPDLSRIGYAMASLEGDDAGTYELVVVDPQGDTLVAARPAFDATPLPESVGDSALEALASRLQGSPLADALRSDGRYPPLYPPFEQLLIGRDGTLWIAGRSAPEGRLYLIHDPAGEPTFTLLLPSNSRIQAVDGNRIWVVERDELGVESLVRYRVREGA